MFEKKPKIPEPLGLI